MITIKYLARFHETSKKYAGVAELVDAPDLGSGAVRCESSSLSFRTIFVGLSPSGKATGFDLVIPWFESR